MKVALIPPIGLLGNCDRTTLQLLLPHMWTDRIYRATYKFHLRDPKQYVIMDNGAAEQEQMRDRTLVHFAAMYEPDEMAIPDHLGDMINTVAHATEFLNNFGMALHEQHRIKLGYVAQGLDPEEAFYGLSKMVNEYGWLIDTIFIPRLLVRNTNITARLELAHMIHDTWGTRFNIHLFGASPRWPGEVIEADKLGYIRSIDTSWPYQASFYKVQMRRRNVGRHVSRPEWYFARSVKEFPNVDTYVGRYLQWANYESTPTPSVKNVP